MTLKLKLFKYRSVNKFSIIFCPTLQRHPVIFVVQVDDEAIWVAQKANRAVKSGWEDAMPLMKKLEFKPKLLMFKSWLWAFAMVSCG